MRKTVPKITSRMRQLRADLKAAATESERMIVLLMADRKDSEGLVRQELYDARRWLLGEIANLDEGDIKLLRKRARSRMSLDLVPDFHLNALRNILQALWSSPGSEQDELLRVWFMFFPHDSNRADTPHWVPSRSEARTLPNPLSVYAQLAQAVLEHHEKFGVCVNPNCPFDRYLLKKRKDQKHCEAGQCVDYSLRQIALKSWYKNGKKRREERTKASKAAESKSTTKRRKK